MMRARRLTAVSIVASGLLLLSACSDDGDDEATDTTEATDDTAATGDTTGEDGGDDGGEAAAFEVDTADCPEDATAPIEGTVNIGATMPLSGGAAAAAFAPVAQGMQNYISFANDNDLVPGYELVLTIEDDQFNSNLTTPAVEGLIDNTGVNLFSGMIGTDNNLAVRDLLNEECYPQLFALTGAPDWGNPEEYPWTIGGLPPYNSEVQIYVSDIEATFPDGATAATFTVNSEFGDSYLEAFEPLAEESGIDVVDQQSIENGDNNPPTSQVNAIAEQQPDVILAVPLGAQCPAFLSALANARAANAGWEPRVYITSTCASTLLLGIAGAAADGIFTIVTGKDANDPANASDPDVAAYLESMNQYGTPPNDDFATAAAGWTTGELTVEVLRLAAESEGGLTRASIINAARGLDYEFQLARDGVAFTLNGTEDAYGFESMQVVQYDADTRTYTDVGSLVTEFEGQTQLPG